jgi:hypothetical protein
MQGLEDHDLDTDVLFDWKYLPHARKLGHEAFEKVFKHDAVSMSEEQGLVLTKDIPPRKGHSSFAGEPAIGCPATFVKHFVRDLHAVAAEACVESGIIPVVEE